MKCSHYYICDCTACQCAQMYGFQTPCMWATCDPQNQKSVAKNSWTGACSVGELLVHFSYSGACHNYHSICQCTQHFCRKFFVYRYQDEIIHIHLCSNVNKNCLWCMLHVHTTDVGT